MSIIHANSATQPRGIREIPPKPGRRGRCPHCKRGRRTHTGVVQAVGVGLGGATVECAMTSGCEWCMRQWARDPRWRFKG